MPHLHLTILSLFLVSVGLGSAEEFLLVAAGGQATAYQIDSASGTLAKTGELDLGMAGPMTEATDRSTIYININTNTEDPKGGKKPVAAIGTFTCDAAGKLTLLQTTPSGMSAGYLKNDATGRFLAGSNYGAGQVSIWEVGENGVFEGKLIRTFELERCAHSAFFAPDNRTLYVPATAPNKIFQLRFNEATGEIYPSQPSSAPGPLGELDAKQPRHLIFHPTKPIAYVTHERELPGAGVYGWDAESGVLTLQQSILSVEPTDEGMTTADLHLSPDGRYLYVSNRDILNRKDPTKGRDSIALFRVDQESGKLEWVERFPCPKVPRSFCRNEAGTLLFVSGQGDNLLATYRIDPESGRLTELGRKELSGRPSWVMCVTR